VWLGQKKAVRRREFLIASVTLSAGCLSAGKDEQKPDPIGEFDVKSSLGANDPLRVTEAVNRSFRTEGDEVIIRDGDDMRRLEYGHWEKELCRDVALVKLREELGESIDITSYSHIVPSFGEVSGPITDGYQGEADELGQYGVSEGSDVVMIQHVSVIDSEASVVRSPALGYEKLVDATPEYVSMSVVPKEGSEETIDCPVLVWKTAQLTP